MQKPDGITVFQSLIAAEINDRNASAVWIDSGNESSTYALTSYGGRKLLEKVYIGRAFTPFQHHRLIQQVDKFLKEDTELLILPNISSMYLKDQLNNWEAEELFQETWQKVLEIQKKHNLKVLTSTTNQESHFDYAVIGDSDNKIKVETTQQGWKYSSNNFDQLMYREKGLMQTTIPYWQTKTSETVKIIAE